MARKLVVAILCAACDRAVEIVAPPEDADRVGRVSPWAIEDHEAAFGHRCRHVTLHYWRGRSIHEVPHAAH